jgi:hypothetical protein
MEAEVSLPGSEQSLAGLRAERLPGRAILNNGKGTIAVDRQERRLETIGCAGMSEEIALTAARSGGVDRVCERQSGG